MKPKHVKGWKAGSLESHYRLSTLDVLTTAVIVLGVILLVVTM